MSCGFSANEYSYVYTGAQINFEDLTPYLTYGPDPEPHKGGGGDNHNSYSQKLRLLFLRRKTVRGHIGRGRINVVPKKVHIYVSLPRKLCDKLT